MKCSIGGLRETKFPQQYYASIAPVLLKFNIAFRGIPQTPSIAGFGKAKPNFKQTRVCKSPAGLEFSVFFHYIYAEDKVKIILDLQVIDCFYLILVKNFHNLPNLCIKSFVRVNTNSFKYLLY